jgi:hypothetical protein
MALYQVVTERLRLSAHRLSSGSGGVAGPDAKDEQKAKNDKGEIDHIRYPLGRGQLVYTDKSDLDGVGDEAKKGNAFYAFDEAEVEQFVAIDALEEVEPSDVEGESTDPRSFGLVGEDYVPPRLLRQLKRMTRTLLRTHHRSRRMTPLLEAPLSPRTVSNLTGGRSAWGST